MAKKATSNGPQKAAKWIKTKAPERSGFYWFRGVDRSDAAWEVVRIDGLSDGRLRVFDTFGGDSSEKFLADWPAGEWRVVVRPVVRAA